MHVKQARNILFFGDSLTAGFGLTPSQAFPAYIQNKIQDMEWNFSVFNAGLSGETSAAGLRRVDWLLRNKVDVLVLALGANDGLRGISPELTEKNLQGIIDKVRRKNPRVKIVIRS
jgi:acyl-CoA thioesterase-1